VREFTGIAKIIISLAVFEYLTASQLTRVGFAAFSIAYVRKQLKALVAQGLVLSLGGRAVNVPLVYTLSSRGRDYAGDAGMPVASRFRLAEEQEKGRNVFVLRHTIAVTDVLIAAWLLSHTHPQIALTRLYTESVLKRKLYVELADRTLCIEPDGSLEFRVTETSRGQPRTWEDFFHVEFYRTHLAEWRFKQKIAGYVSYIETGVHEQHFGTPAFSLAVIAATDDLAERLKRWTEEVLGALDQPEQGERFFFCSCDPATVSPEELFLSPVWKQACSSGKTPLLVLE
jgi:Replication-relaxation